MLILSNLVPAINGFIAYVTETAGAELALSVRDPATNTTTTTPVTVSIGKNQVLAIDSLKEGTEYEVSVLSGGVAHRIYRTEHGYALGDENLSVGPIQTIDYEAVLFRTRVVADFFKQAVIEQMNLAGLTPAQKQQVASILRAALKSTGDTIADSVLGNKRRYLENELALNSMITEGVID